ncbi:Rieske (2Fe-2S) protein [Pseudonocardia sp. NPDC049154]|uniref:QcrA and Rieske domain-containing protein n=1 Tax=Pseudonocardia sp. NPDC049154 TaxID=3155501 RepID=UPI0033CB67D6
MPDDHAAPTTPALSRRAAVAGAGAAAVGIGLLAAGCSSGDSGSGSGSGGGATTGSSAAPSASAGTALGPASSVPVGSAALFADQKVIVTQPTAGTYEGFSSTCPHQGCTVSEVQGAALVCPCHGSTFGLDGQVQKGPATRGLTPQNVTVSGDRITLA